MGKKNLRIKCLLVAVAAAIGGILFSGTMAFADPPKAPETKAKTYGGYGFCGDGILERFPNIGVPSSQLYMEQCDNGASSMQWGTSDKGCYYSALTFGCKINQDFHGNGIIERYNFPDKTGNDSKVQWEQCDDGNHIDSDFCNNNGQINGGFNYLGYTDKDGNFHKNDELCGNGVIDGKGSSAEECDSGQGNKPVVPVDTGLNHTAGVCTNDCKYSKPIPHTKAGYNGTDYKCEQRKLCGDAIVDREAGEQCDDGFGKNGSPTSSCTAFCTFASSNPTFSTSNFIFKTPGGSGILDGNLSGTDVVHAGSGNLSVGSVPVDPVGTTVAAYKGKFNIFDRGRVLVLERNPGVQYSGIALSGQDITPTPEGTHIHFSFRPRAAGTQIDNDTFGLVFGVDKNVFTDANANYLMLKWRSGHFDATGDYSQVDDKVCKNPVYAGTREDQGLRLFQVHGTPSYDELWGMKNCGTRNSITHIPTEMYQDTGESLYDWALNQTDPIYYKLTQNQYDWFKKQTWVTDDDKKLMASSPNLKGITWNNMINPAFTWATYYLNQLHIIRDGDYQVLQIDAVINAHNKKNLRVWVNYQQVIDVDGSEFPGDFWPVQGQWGFYFLGMDNFIADFRSFEDRITDDPWLNIADAAKMIDAANKLPNETSTGTRCDYCGDGRYQSYKETCDDGNNVNGDGCDSCSVTPGWTCKNYLSVPGKPAQPSVCFKVDVISPPATPTIISTPDKSSSTIDVKVEGTYVFGSKAPTITVDSSGAGFKGCTNVTIDPSVASGSWSSVCTFDTPSATQSYTITTKAEYDKEVETINRDVTIDNTVPVLTVDAIPNPMYNGSGLKFKFKINSGKPKFEVAPDKCVSLTSSNCKSVTTAENVDVACVTSGSNKVCESDYTGLGICSSTGHCDETSNGKYTYTFSSTDGVTKKTTTVNKTVVLDTIAPKLVSLKSPYGGGSLLHSSALIGYKGDKAKLQGKIDICNFPSAGYIACKDAVDANAVAPIKNGKVTFSFGTDSAMDPSTTKEVSVDKDGNIAPFDLTLPKSEDRDTHNYLWICSEDAAGNDLTADGFTLKSQGSKPDCIVVSSVAFVDLVEKQAVSISPADGDSVYVKNGATTQPVTVYFLPKLSASPGANSDFLNLKTCTAAIGKTCTPTQNDALKTECLSNYDVASGSCTFNMPISLNTPVVTVEASAHYPTVNGKPVTTSSTFTIDDRNPTKNQLTVDVVGTGVSGPKDGPKTLDLVKSKGQLQVKVSLTDARVGDVAEVAYDSVELGRCKIQLDVPSCKSNCAGSCTVTFDDSLSKGSLATLPKSGFVRGVVDLNGSTASVVGPASIKLNITPTISIQSPKDDSQVPVGQGISVKTDSDGDCSAANNCTPVVWYCTASSKAGCIKPTNAKPITDGKVVIPHSDLTPDTKYTVVAGVKVTNGTKNTYIPLDSKTIDYTNAGIPDCTDPQTVGVICKTTSSTSPINIHLDGGDPDRVVKVKVFDKNGKVYTVCPNSSGECHFDNDGKWTKDNVDVSKDDKGQSMTGPFVIVSELGPCEIGKACTVNEPGSNGKVSVGLTGGAANKGKKIVVSIVDKNNSKARVDVCTKAAPCTLNKNGDYSVDHSPTTASGVVNAPYSIESCYADDPKCGGSNGGGGKTVTCQANNTCTASTSTDTTNDFPLTVKIDGDPNTPYRVEIFNDNGEKVVVCEGLTGPKACRTDASGHLTKTVSAADATINGKTISGPIKVVSSEIPTCDSSKTTDKCPNIAAGTDSKIPVDVSGKPGQKVNITITDKDGKKKTVCSGGCTIASDGHYKTEVEPKDDSGQPMTGPYTIHVESGAGQGQGGSTVASASGVGTVAGGCGCASTTPTDGFFSLLFAALGLFFLRRRKDEE